MSSYYRCATCDIRFKTRRALTNHLRQQEAKNEPHAACNDESGQSSASLTGTTSSMLTSSIVWPTQFFGTSDQPVEPPVGGSSGSYSNEFGRSYSPDGLKIGNVDSQSIPFESPGADSSPYVSYQLLDTSLCDKLARHVHSGHGTTPLSADHTSEFKLLDICKPFSLKLYDDIIKWAHESFHAGVDFSSKLRTRKPVLKQIETRFNMQGDYPQVKKVFLPGCGQLVELMVHDFKDQIYSLLSDFTVMLDKNLLFHNNNPFQPPLNTTQRKGSYVYQDVNDGSVYYEAYQTHCTVEGRDILCAVIAFVDKSHMDVTNSRLCMEPFAVTLSMFKKESRTQPMFWRPLGYLVNQSQLSYTNGLDKARDYHIMLEVILKSLVDVQNGPGISWKLNYNGVTHDVVFKFPLMFVSGNTEGHHMLVGKYLSRSLNVA